MVVAMHYILFYDIEHSAVLYNYSFNVFSFTLASLEFFIWNPIYHFTEPLKSEFRADNILPETSGIDSYHGWLERNFLIFNFCSMKARPINSYILYILYILWRVEKNISWSSWTPGKSQVEVWLIWVLLIQDCKRTRISQNCSPFIMLRHSH